METRYMEANYMETDLREASVVRQLLIDPDIALAEHLLTEAGIGFTEVARCPAGDCEVCEPVTLGTAA